MNRRSEPLLSVRNLKKYYSVGGGVISGDTEEVRAVDGIDFEVYQGETFGIVGESGCGKSTAALSLLRIEEPTEGEIRYSGENILKYDTEEMRRLRRKAQMIFQDPESSFDPRMNVGSAVAEPLIVQGVDDDQVRKSVVQDLLSRVGLSEDDIKRYPHEFSGGQKQRLGLARALSVNPQLIVADEPVSALDVSLQSEILRLLNEFQEELDLTIIIISHDLGVIERICDRVAVMYLGEFVEVGPTDEIFANPQHPYTRSLLSAIPTPDPTDTGLDVELSGTVPDPENPPSGCRFHTRCPEVIPPDEIDLPQDDWRNVLDLREQIASESIDLAGIVEIRSLGSDEYAEDIEPTEIDNQDLQLWIREEYDIPEQLSDCKAEETLKKGLSLFLNDETTRASEVLAETFTTICEKTKPELQECGKSHEASCHLLDYSDDGSDTNAQQTR